MDYSYLYHTDIPKGVKSVYINGKKISREEFIKERKNFFSKKAHYEFKDYNLFLF